MATILIIDDQVDMRKLLRRALESFGHQVLEADDGKKGMDLCRETLPDLILTDIFMPEKDGLETIRELRKIHPKLKVLAMSGGGTMGNMDVLRIARAMGAYKVLAKPFSMIDLKETISAALSKDTPSTPPA